MVTVPIVPDVPVAHNVPAVPDPTIKRNIYLDLLYCRQLQYVNRNRLRKIGQEQAKEARVCRDKRLNKIKEVIKQSDKISKWCDKSKA